MPQALFNIHTAVIALLLREGRFNSINN